MTPETGPTVLEIFDSLITLESGHVNDIAGRAIVIHAGTDDLGLGGDAGSVATGNAGGRLACGLIVAVGT